MDRDRAGEFRIDLERFARECAAADGPARKAAWKALARKWHPDADPSEAEFRNGCMMALNYAWDSLSRRTSDAPSGDSRIRPGPDGRYSFVNRGGHVERITDRETFLYKVGWDRINSALDWLCSHPLVHGYGDEVVGEAVRRLWSANEYLREALRTPPGAWREEAREKLAWAWEINLRVTRRLAGERDLVVRPD